VPALADLLAAAAWLPSSWIASVAEVSAGLPGAVLPVVAGPMTAAVVGVLSAAVGVVLVRSRRPWLHAGSVGVLVITVAIAGARMLLTGPLAEAGSPGDWSIAACDVGQGDAVLVRSEGVVALIDAGPEPDLLDACLRDLGIERIDLLVLTHFDLDHSGGADALPGRVGTVLHGPVTEGDQERLLAALRDGGARLVQGATGMDGELGAATWEVIWPRPDDPVYPEGNDASVVIEVAGGGVPRTLFLGDLSAAPQRQLVRDDRVTGAYDVVKVAHHGSADQDAGLYEHLHARAALISVGADNDYGHPRTETLAFLEAAGSHILRTDERGRILLSLRDGELAVWAERGGGDDGADDVGTPD
jgi:competence protein ComEC